MKYIWQISSVGLLLLLTCVLSESMAEETAVSFSGPDTVSSVRDGNASQEPQPSVTTKKEEEIGSGNSDMSSPEQATYIQILDALKKQLEIDQQLLMKLSKKPDGATGPLQQPSEVAAQQAVTSPETEAEKQAYASGVNLWRDISNSLAMQQSLGIHLDSNLVLAGLTDSSQGNVLRLSEPEISAAMNALNQDYMSRDALARERQIKMGDAYLDNFRTEKGVFSDAGSWYRIISEGSGKKLSANDLVHIKISGTLPDGTVFDGVGNQDEVRKIKVNSLLPAVSLGLQKVAPGGHIKIVVPPDKGYGDAGLPPAIPGGATLIFDIQVQRVLREKAVTS
ncbi:hypothetical protein HCH73_19080 [Citrobacter koseri]|uniref:FKBP-type peptidyl-prolyl cis-trans isomerase n=1 Tax=Citrobacter koseri TaxID=545 RepID=UPI0018E13A2E|nr:FKBP-type peptidyl-prolyl cis-trans isomerase [Citrobacter koseri]MBI0679133.1 hypothetical protein [Citrobacter koseri]